MLLTTIPPLIALGAALWHGPYLIDDAYITFRYAENLAAGHGVVFNPGEPVLGTSTPLFAILLGLLRLAGAGVPLAARVLGLASVAGVVLITQRLAARTLGPLGAAAVAVCLALHPDLAFTANSGMETGLSMVAVYGTLLLVLQGRYFAGGLLGAAGFLLRPDGAVVVILAVGLALLRARRRAWQPLLAAAIVALPWLIYAAVTYGGLLPHSVQAKQLIHADRPLLILVDNLQRISFGLAMKIVCGFAVAGLIVAVVRRSELLLVALWMVLYLAGLSAACILSLFPWYVSPLFPGLLLLAGYGGAGLGRALFRWAVEPATARRLAARGGAPVVPLILAGLCLHDTASWGTVMYRSQFGERAAAYLQIGAVLRERCAPGDVVFVGEVGALSYALPEQVILDSSGINSPAVFQARRADHERLVAAGMTRRAPEGSPAWVLAVIAQFEPRYIVTYRPWLHMRRLMRLPQITMAYRRLALPGLDDYIVLERIARLGSGPVEP